MFTLKQALKDAEKKEVAVGHFNISELTALRAIFEAAREIAVPVIVGFSEGEREFVGLGQCAALIRSLREEFQYPIFANADHTHSLEAAERAARAGFDAVLFDGSGLPMAENLRKTSEVVKRLKSINKDILVEGELGYIGSSSEIREGIPEGAAIKPKDMTKANEAQAFVNTTGVDLFAPSVGNIHGMMKDAPEPALNIERIKAIAEVIDVPLVLHGGSGNTEEDFTLAIDAGIRVIHISTELRFVWRRSLEKSLLTHKKEIAPYKIFPEVVSDLREVVLKRLKLFNKLV